MSKILPKTPIINIVDGEQVEIEGTPATLGSVIMRALLNISPGDKLSGEDSFRRYQLATKFASRPETVELTVEEISFIKKTIGEVFGPAVVGPAWNILEGIDPPKAKDS